MSPIVIDRTFGHRSTMSTSTITSASARTRGDGRIVRKSGASRDMPLGDAQKRIPPRKRSPVIARNFVYHQAMLGDFWKVGEQRSTQQPEKQWSDDSDYVVSQAPHVPRESRQIAQEQSPVSENSRDLPRFHGQPVLFGIARDPHTLFVYWEIDWHKVFGERPPSDRKVHLRVLGRDGSQETRAAVEPLAGNHYLPVAHAREVYRIELGYEEPAGTWHSVATSEGIATPPDDVSLSAEVDVATIPFHLSFQYLIDRLRAAKGNVGALVDAVGRLQERADNGADLNDDEKEFLRAIEDGPFGPEVTERARLRKSGDPFGTRARLKSILGAGATSR